MMLDVMYWLYVILFSLVPIQILYDVSSTFRYYVKFIVLCIAAFILSLYAIIRCLPRPGHLDNHRYVSQSLRILCRLMGLEVVVEGKKHIPDTPCVLVANHQSAFDLVAMCAVRPARCALVAKQQARFHLTIGVVAMLIGTVFVDKHHTKRAIATMDKAVDAIRRDKISLFLYPEGSRNPDGGLLPFKKGAFHVAIQAQVPVVPVVITGYKTFYSAREKRFESGTLTVTCLPQISTRNLTTKHVDELSHRVRQQMLTVFNKRN